MILHSELFKKNSNLFIDSDFLRKPPNREYFTFNITYIISFKLFNCDKNNRFFENFVIVLFIVTW